MIHQLISFIVNFSYESSHFWRVEGEKGVYWEIYWSAQTRNSWRIVQKEQSFEWIGHFSFFVDELERLNLNVARLENDMKEDICLMSIHAEHIGMEARRIFSDATINRAHQDFDDFAKALTESVHKVLDTAPKFPSLRLVTSPQD